MVSDADLNGRRLRYIRSLTAQRSIKIISTSEMWAVGCINYSFVSSEPACSVRLRQ